MEAKNKADTDRYNWEVNRQEIGWRNANADKQWMGSLISNVGGMAMNFAEKYNPTTLANAEYRRSLENKLLESEILRNNSSVAKMFQPSVATVSGNVQKSKNGVDIFSASGLSGSPNPKSWKSGDVSVTNPVLEKSIPTMRTLRAMKPGTAKLSRKLLVGVIWLWTLLLIFTLLATAGCLAPAGTG